MLGCRPASLTFEDEQPHPPCSAKLPDSETIVALAAFYDEHLIGSLVAYVLPTFEQAPSRIYISVLTVAEERGRLAAAICLIQASEGIASQQVHMSYLFRQTTAFSLPLCCTPSHVA